MSGINDSMHFGRGSPCWDLKDEQKLVVWQAEREQVKAEGRLYEKKQKIKRAQNVL